MSLGGAAVLLGGQAARTAGGSLTRSNSAVQAAEFYRAIELLADAQSEMRDMLVLFKDVGAERIRDPGDDLKFETFDSEASLRHKLGRKMREWLQDDGPKAPVVVDLSPATIDTGALQKLDHAELLEAARSYTEQKLFTQAEAAYAAAADNNDPAIVLEFGQFMRRRGRAERAMELNLQVVADGALLASARCEAAALRVRAMSNIGVLQRQLGELGQSLRLLGGSRAERQEGPAAAVAWHVATTQPSRQ